MLLAQLSDRSTEVGLDAIGLLEAVLDQQLHEGPVLHKLAVVPKEVISPRACLRI